MKPSEMDRGAFVATFGGVFEHSPWVAENTFDQGIGRNEDTAEGLHAAMCAEMRKGSPERQLELLRAHPDLAGKLARSGELTAESTGEQKSAGLDRLSDAEFERFTELNDAYKAKFGFPFIVAVRGKDKHDILAAFERRSNNSAEQELYAAIREVEQIARLRIEALFNG